MLFEIIPLEQPDNFREWSALVGVIGLAIWIFLWMKYVFMPNYRNAMEMLYPKDEEDPLP